MFEKRRYFQDTQNVRLSADEKLATREKLQAFMQAHPVRGGANMRQLEQEVHLNFLSSLKSMMLKPLPITLSALLVLGGGTAFAAERSLPTEALYPIKIQVNERVRATLTPTSEGKAKWQARVAERRLEEAERLALQKKFNTETQAQIELSFDEQAKLVQEKIARLKAEGNIEGAIELSNSFQASLKAHEAILTQLDAQHENKEAFDPLLEKVKLNASVVSFGKEDLDAATTVDAQAELKMMAQQKQQITSDSLTSAKQAFSASTNLNSELKIKVTALLQLANEELGKGNEQFNQTNFKLALSHFEQADTHAQSALIVIKTAQTLKLDATFPLPTTKEDPKSAIDIQIKTETDVKNEVKQDPIIIEPKATLETESKSDILIKSTPEIDKTNLDAKQETNVQEENQLKLGL